MKYWKLGEFSVGAIKGKGPDVEPTDGGATSPLDGSKGGKSSDTQYKRFTSWLMNVFALHLVGSNSFFKFNTELIL